MGVGKWKSHQISLHGCKIIPPHVLSALFGLIYRPRDFASYMLGIFICNLLLYLAFYIIMKVSAAAGSLGAPPPQALHRQCRQLGGLCFSPTAPQLREGPPHPVLLHHCHGCGVGRCPVFFLPESQQLGGKRAVFFSKMFSLHLAFRLCHLSLFMCLLLFIFFTFSKTKGFSKSFNIHTMNGPLSSLSR